MWKVSRVILIIGMVLFVAMAMVDTPAEASQTKPIVLKVSNYSTPPPIPYGIATTWYLRRIEDATNHRIKFEEYWTGTLLPHKTEVEGLKGGMADVAFFQVRYQKARLPLFYLTCLPATARDVRASCAAMNDLAKLPEIQKEFDRYNMVWLAAGTGAKRGIYTKDKPIRSLADLKGMKIRSRATNILDGVGATTISISSSEMYEAMQRGVVDGIATPITGGVAWKVSDISKYYWDGDVGMVTMCAWMNKKKWNSLPEDIQKIFRKVGEDEFPLMYDLYLRAQGNAQGLYDIFPKRGIEVTRPTLDEVEKIQKLARVDWDDYLKKIEKKGLPARKVLDEWLRLNRYYEGYYLVAQ